VNHGSDNAGPQHALALQNPIYPEILKILIQTRGEDQQTAQISLSAPFTGICPFAYSGDKNSSHLDINTKKTRKK
jgi:hypothetical protein